MDNQIEIYQSTDGQTQVEVTFEEETVWLTQKALAELFRTTVPNINIHLKNIFYEGELTEHTTIKDFLIVWNEGRREVKRVQKYYNLDAIISVGYRIKSEVATKFRQWATQRIRDYLVQGYAINEKRLAQKQQEIQTLKDGIRILSRAISDKAGDEGLEWLSHFAKGLELLDDYDHEQLDSKGLTKLLYLVDLIPGDTDILITHGPPFGILDMTIRGEHTGCEELLRKIERVKPKLHVFGHIHEDHGQETKGDTIFVNASVLDSDYQLVHKPVIIPL